MKLISWNVAGRVQRTLRYQLQALLGLGPDVVALQELTLATMPDWEHGLRAAGYVVESTIELVREPYPEPPYESPPLPPPRGGGIHDHFQRKNFNLTASRYPIEALPGLSFDDSNEARLAFPEKYLACRVSLGRHDIEIHNAHLPPGSTRGLIKVHAFEAIRKRVTENPDVPRVLCGDFNAPAQENVAGPVIERGGRWSEADQDRWVAAETALLTSQDMRDVYRDDHRGGPEFPISHVTRSGPKRYDYILASEHFQTVRCRYHSEWLDRDESGWRLSDHAPVDADLELGQI
jgi:endonuclease/exonuclease/phosphatase family metal-dependent hydrolase